MIAPSKSEFLEQVLETRHQVHSLGLKNPRARGGHIRAGLRGGESRRRAKASRIDPSLPMCPSFKDKVSWILDCQTGLQLNKWLWSSDPPTATGCVLELEVPQNPGSCDT